MDYLIFPLGGNIPYFRDVQLGEKKSRLVIESELHMANMSVNAPRILHSFHDISELLSLVEQCCLIFRLNLSKIDPAMVKKSIAGHSSNAGLYPANLATCSREKTPLIVPNRD